MEKRVLGISLSILGVIGLIMAGVNFMNGVQGGNDSRQILMYSVLGIIFFISGISLVRSTKDKPT